MRGRADRRLRTSLVLAAALAATGACDAGRAAHEGPCPPITVDGRVMRCADGSLFRWRGVTGFRLIHQVATGDEAGATAYLDWARATGFNVVRAVAHESLLFDLSPEAGQAALPRALDLAGSRDLLVEVVAVTDTGDRPYDFRAHARRVAEICAAHANCLFEFANEPGHPTQVAELHDMRIVDEAAAAAVRGLGLSWTAGTSWESDLEPIPGGAYIVRHLDRGGDGWRQAARLREFERLGAKLGKPVVSNEPIGFDEVDGAITRRQRLDDCDVALAFGVLSRVFEVGTTFHLQAGLQNDVPGPVQGRCADEFVRGSRVLPDEARVELIEGSDAASPVAAAPPGAGPVFVGRSGDRAIVAAIGPAPLAAPQPRTGWTIESTPIERPQIKVWILKRSADVDRAPDSP